MNVQRTRARRGIGLVEVMVAIAIGGLLIAAIAQLSNIGFKSAKTAESASAMTSVRSNLLSLLSNPKMCRNAFLVGTGSSLAPATFSGSGDVDLNTIQAKSPSATSSSTVLAIGMAVGAYKVTSLALIPVIGADPEILSSGNRKFYATLGVTFTRTSVDRSFGSDQKPLDAIGLDLVVDSSNQIIDCGIRSDLNQRTEICNQLGGSMSGEKCLPKACVRAKDSPDAVKDVDFTASCDENEESCTVFCKANETLLSCSGSRNPSGTDSCDEEDCGIVGVMPTVSADGRQGCYMLSDGSKSYPVAFCQNREPDVLPNTLKCPSAATKFSITPAPVAITSVAASGTEWVVNFTISSPGTSDLKGSVTGAVKLVDGAGNVLKVWSLDQKVNWKAPNGTTSVSKSYRIKLNQPYTNPDVGGSSPIVGGPGTYKIVLTNKTGAGARSSAEHTRVVP